ncbi:MAG TPA: homocysteine S-methyltransferase family protein [Chthoniobacterales bacterium]|nr:homocysteine S-methyltransferase family protein [Chthoniobacterales bacterium]
MDFLDEAETGILCGDGAMGTLLLDAGFALDDCLEALCLSDPAQIRRVHDRYIAAGARVIETNTFGANAVRLARFGLEHQVAEINRAGAAIARDAASGERVYVAGSVGPLGISATEAANRGIDRAGCFREQISSLIDAGVSLIVLETFTSVEEMEVAFRAKLSLGQTPTVCSFSCGPAGILHCGTEIGDAITRIQQIGPALFGVNCMNDPAATLELIRRIPRQDRFAAYPAAGYPQQRDSRYHYPVEPAQFASVVPDLIAEGVRLIGGCCGTTPAHIAAVASAVARCE